MPLMILLKAANTPLDGPTWPACVLLGFRAAGPASESADLLTVLGVGEGFGATTRVRVDGVVGDSVLCADTRAAHASTTETITRNLFTIVSSSSEPCAPAAVLLKFIPPTLAAQAHHRTLAAEDLKDLKH